MIIWKTPKRIAVVFLVGCMTKENMNVVFEIIIIIFFSWNNNLKEGNHLEPLPLFSFILFFIIAGDAYNLFAFPSECNFSGLRFSLDLVNIVKQNAENFLEGSPYSKYVVFILCILYKTYLSAFYH